MSDPVACERIGTIFIVDDEPMVTASLKTMLSLETKYLIHTFNNPLEALDALSQIKPDVIISDFSMPQMDGISFLQAVKTHLPEATLILLTGYADKESAIKAINTVGIYRYIEKPWDNEELKINIKNGLERAYLVADLRGTIQQLSETQHQLKETNQQLEALVEARTKDLQVTYQKLQSIVQNSADGILTLNDLLEITSINPTIERWITQYLSSDSVEHVRLEQLLHLPDGRKIQSMFAEEGIRVAEAMIGSLPVEISQAAIPTGGYVLILRDITQRKEIERLRDDFVSTLTHDLRTPLLAGIQTLGFFIDGTVSSDEQRRELTEMLIQSLREMLGLVNVLLEVYKYEAGRQRLVFSPTDISVLVRSVCQELEALAKSREMVLTTEVTLETPSVEADKQELKRVFVNLIGNAIHHSPVGGKIHVTLTRDSEKGLLVQVKDNGRGIPAKDLPHLFQRFSQGTSNKRSSGSGLGLYLSRQIIDAHRGQIWVESIEGVGSCFSVSLPVPN